MPTNDMGLPIRVKYLTQKTLHFIWRYRKNPLYMLTYLRFVADASYKENVHFMSDDIFIKEAKKRSTLRLQDGEFTLLLGTRDLSDEKKDDRVITMWKEAIATYSDESPYILGLPPYIIIKNRALHEHAFKYLWMPAKIFYRLQFPKTAFYFNGSYFYIDNTTLPFMQTLSEGNNVLLVSNKEVIDATKVREKDFFKNSLSVAYIETPKKHASTEYENIIRAIETHSGEKTVIFMACGASGKAMIYDLSKKGIRAHDIGWGLTGAYTGESREHFLKWDVFGALYQKLRAQSHEN
jgi:hypothetical protein